MVESNLRRPQTAYDLACDAMFVARVIDPKTLGVPTVHHYKSNRMEIIYSNMGGKNRVTVNYRGRPVIESLTPDNTNPNNSSVDGKLIDVFVGLYEEAHSEFAWESRKH